jgi:hypothetical protein
MDKDFRSRVGGLRCHVFLAALWKLYVSFSKPRRLSGGTRWAWLLSLFATAAETVSIAVSGNADKNEEICSNHLDFRASTE